MIHHRVSRYLTTVLIAATAALVMVETAYADIERIREKAWELEQQLHAKRYDSQVKGKEPNTLRVLKDFAFILKPSKVEEVRSEKTEPRDEALALYLEERLVDMELATYTDDQHKQELADMGDLEGESLNRGQLLSRLATAGDAASRRKIYTVLRPMFDTTNIYRNQVVVRRNEMYQGIGYKHFADFYEKREGVDLTAVETRAKEFLAESQELYDMLFEAIAEERMGVQTRKVKFYDLPYLGSSEALSTALSGGDRGERAAAILKGLGLDELAAIEFNDREREGRYSQGVYALTVPADVRVGLTERGGSRDDRDALYLMGQAGFYALNKTSTFEESYLVPDAVEASVGYLVRSVMDETGWLASAGLTEEQMEQHRKYRAFERLLEIRMLAAQVIFEKDLYSGGSAPDEVFKAAMKEATGTRLSSVDVSRNLEFASQLDSAAQFQGLMAAENLRNHLRTTLAEDWYTGGKAGDTLKAWYARGGGLTLESLMSDAGGAASSAVIDDIQSTK